MKKSILIILFSLPFLFMAIPALADSDDVVIYGTYPYEYNPVEYYSYPYDYYAPEYTYGNYYYGTYPYSYNPYLYQNGIVLEVGGGHHHHHHHGW